MRHEDLFKDERAKIERALEALDRIAAQVEAGEPVPAEAAATVALLDETEEAEYDASQNYEDRPVLTVCVAEHEAARVLLRQLRRALDARERGDAAAGPMFVQNARDYVQLRREHMRRDDRLFAKVTGGAKA
jgi:hemerythrin-like domain-containing protein